MTSDDEVILSALQFLYSLAQQLQDFENSIKAAFGIAKAAHDVEYNIYTTGPIISAWLEADLSETLSLTWWLDMIPQESGWLLDAHVAWNGSDVIIQLPEQLAADFQDVKLKAPSVLTELLDCGRNFLIRNNYEKEG